jgi:hypothetical protein
VISIVAQRARGPSPLLAERSSGSWAPPSPSVASRSSRMPAERRAQVGERDRGRAAEPGWPARAACRRSVGPFYWDWRSKQSWDSSASCERTPEGAWHQLERRFAPDGRLNVSGEKAQQALSDLDHAPGLTHAGRIGRGAI